MSNNTDGNMTKGSGVNKNEDNDDDDDRRTKGNGNEDRARSKDDAGFEEEEASSSQDKNSRFGGKGNVDENETQHDFKERCSRLNLSGGLQSSARNRSSRSTDNDDHGVGASTEAGGHSEEHHNSYEFKGRLSQELMNLSERLAPATLSCDDEDEEEEADDAATTADSVVDTTTDTATTGHAIRITPREMNHTESSLSSSSSSTAPFRAVAYCVDGNGRGQSTSDERIRELERQVEERDRSLQGFTQQLQNTIQAVVVVETTTTTRREQDDAEDKETEERRERRSQRSARIASGFVLLLLSGIVMVVIYLTIGKPWNGTNHSGFSCFTNRAELLKAVDEYFFVIRDGEELGARYNVSLVYGYPIRSWCVGKVQNFSRLFSYRRNRNLSLIFNEDISDWDVSHAIAMDHMFFGARTFNQNLSTWNVSSVADMGSMFREALSFNNDISTWDVSSCWNMPLMFQSTEFDGDISEWDVSKVAIFRYMFRYNTKFNSDISKWNMSNATTVRAMFRECHSFDGDLSNWDVSSVADMRSVFYDARSFNNNISGWDVSRVIHFSGMFRTATSFNQDISMWDVSSGMNFDALFNSASNFSQDLCSWGSKIQQHNPNVTFSQESFAETNCDSRSSPDLDAIPLSPLCAICGS